MNVIDLENKFTEMLTNVMNEDAAEALAQAVSETAFEEFEKGYHGMDLDVEEAVVENYDEEDYKVALSDAVVELCKK